MRVEVLNGVERRRRWTRDEKARVLAESLEPGAKVAEVARRNDLAPSVLFSWRRAARIGKAAPPSMVRVIIAEPAVAPPVSATPRRTRGPAKDRGLIEIDLGGGRCVRVDARVDGKALGAGSQLPVHAETLAQEGQQQDGESVQEQQVVAALRILDA